MSRAQASLERLLAARDGAGDPRFLSTQRDAGASAFFRLKLPTTKQEDWKYTSLTGLSDVELRRAERGVAAEPGRLELPAAPRLVFVNGRHDPALSDLSGVPAGVTVASLADALARTPDAVEPWLGRRARGDEHPFAGLNAALFEDGAFVAVPAGAALERTVHLVHLSTSAAGAAIHPRHVVVAGAGARARIAELYAGEDGAYLVNALTEIYAADGAEVEHYRVQREGAGVFHVGLVEVEQGASSRVRSHSVALGGRVARVEARALLAAEKAECTFEGLYLPRGSQLHDHLVLVDHASPGCTSRELFKGVLDDRAHGVFAGRITVRPGAQKTNADQVNSNLLLSEDAVIDTKPQLEIDADDVKCSHGGSVGQLDENALFYLRSRGVDAATARALLTYAFASELVERVGPADLRDRVRRLVAAQLPAGDKLLEAA